MLFETYVLFHSFTYVRVTEWPPIGKYLLTRLTTCSLSISTYCCICQFGFPHLVFWSDCAFS